MADEDQTPVHTTTVQGDGWLRIRLGDATFALSLHEIDGLAEPGPIRDVPGAPVEIAGLTEWQGQLLTVLDLQRLLEWPTGDALPSLIRLAPPHGHLALLVRHAVELDVGVSPWPVDAGDPPDRPRPPSTIVRLDPAGLLRRVMRGA